MITRYAMFIGAVKAGKDADMRAWVTEHLKPLWCQFACAEEVRVLYGVEQDDNGPIIPLVLAISYADHEAMERGVNSPARFASRDLLPEFYERFFDEVVLWHYVMEVDTSTFNGLAEG